MKILWQEEWKEIPLDRGEKKKYAVSNYGRVASYKISVKEDGKPVNGSIVGGYPLISIRVDEKYTFRQYLHKIVAEYFLDKPQEDQTYVLHLDYDKRNNKITNLKYANKEEMVKHQFDSPFVIERKKRKKEDLYEGHKLNVNKVRLIKKMIFDPNRKTRMKMIAKQFNISEMQLYRIKNGENWSHVKVDESEFRPKRDK